MKKYLVFLLASGVMSAAIAAPQRYVIDTSHSMPRFEYNHFGYSTQLSRFDNVTGTISLDRVAKTGSLEVTIDAKSVNTGSALFNQHIQAEDFFDTEQYPTIQYRSDRIQFKGDQPVAVEGKLTIKGVTKPVTLTISSFKCMPHPMVKKEACGANASAQIKRSDFNMGKHAPYVSDEVTLTIPVEAIHE